MKNHIFKLLLIGLLVTAICLYLGKKCAVYDTNHNETISVQPTKK